MSDMNVATDEEILPKRIRFLAPKFICELNHKESRKCKIQKLRNNTKTHSSSINKSRLNTNIPTNGISNLNGRSRTLQDTLKIQHQHRNLFDVSRRRTQLNMNGNKVFGILDEEGLHGKTEVLFSNGAKFSGKFSNGKMLSGKFQFTNGFIYEGGFHNNKFFGYGTLRFPNGKIISGQWNGQKIQGYGQIKYPKGEIYQGEIENFRKNGFGYLFFQDERKFIGNFIEGKINGQGSYFIDEKLVAEGIWKDGQLIAAEPLEKKSQSEQSILHLSNKQLSRTRKFEQQDFISLEFQKCSINEKSSINQKSSKNKAKMVESVKIVSENDDDNAQTLESREEKISVMKGTKKKVGWACI